MSVEMILGMTKSGKSFCANKLRAKYPKSVVLDKAHCFEGDIFYNPTIKDVLKIFKKYRDKSSYQLVFRPKGMDYERLFINVSFLVKYLGAIVGIYENQKAAPDAVYFLIDEADNICNPNYQSPQLKFLVNEGRHWSVDTAFIARVPQGLHGDIKANASSIRCFFLQSPLALAYLKNAFDANSIKQIAKLKPHCHLHWQSTGQIRHVAPNGI